MKLYIFSGSQAYKSLYYKDIKSGKKYANRLIGIPLINEWEKCEVEIVFRGELASKNIDIMDFGGFAGVVLSPNAKGMLQDIILPFCEFLPVILFKNTVYLLNATIILDCIDMEESEIEKFPPLFYEKQTNYIFKKDVNYPPIFRIQNKPKDIIVTDEFVIKLKETNLEGYKLTKLWDSDEKE